MVAGHIRVLFPSNHFQYSLCRVVLMVDGGFVWAAGVGNLSVLALSSRFDGLQVV